MPPDLNSLPPSRSTSSSPFQSRNMAASSEGTSAQSPSPRSSSVSLQAAATMNAADRSRRSSSSLNRSSPQANRLSERRRSAVAINLNLNDPALPGPGELSAGDHRSSMGASFRNASPSSLGGSPTIATGDPHHQRTPSLGELHQELEQEQEAQVNRLLHMIRTQQAQLQQMQQQQQQQQQSGASGTAIADDSTPTSERSFSLPAVPPLPIPGRRSSAHMQHNRRSSGQAASPSLQPSGSQQTAGVESGSLGSADWSVLSGGDGAGRRSSRDESAFFQAETASLTRENQMLRLRIRELERQIGELTSASTHTPATGSNLSTGSSVAESGPTTPALAEATSSTGTPAEAAKP